MRMIRYSIRRIAFGDMYVQIMPMERHLPFESSLIQGNEKEEFPNENKMEGYLADYIRRNDYEKVELECATIFRSRSG